MYQVTSELNGHYASIDEFPELTDAQINIARQIKSGEANFWQLGKVGEAYHFEGTLKNDGSIDYRRVPPLNKKLN